MPATEQRKGAAAANPNDKKSRKQKMAELISGNDDEDSVAVPDDVASEDGKTRQQVLCKL